MNLFNPLLIKKYRGPVVLAQGLTEFCRRRAIVGSALKITDGAFKICQIGQLAHQKYAAAAKGPRNIWGELTDVKWFLLNVYKSILIQKHA